MYCAPRANHGICLTEKSVWRWRPYVNCIIVNKLNLVKLSHACLSFLTISIHKWWSIRHRSMNLHCDRKSVFWVFARLWGSSRINTVTTVGTRESRLWSISFGIIWLMWKSRRRRRRRHVVFFQPAVIWQTIRHAVITTFSTVVECCGLYDSSDWHNEQSNAWMYMWQIYSLLKIIYLLFLTILSAKHPSDTQR